MNARPFGTLQPNLSQSDYLRQKKCKCDRNNVATQLQNNKTNLIIGQYSHLNLSGVCTTSTQINTCNGTPIIIDSNVPFYHSNVIDPFGQLFGKKSCGALNYTNYMTIN